MSEPVRRSGFSRDDLALEFAARGYRRGAEIGVRQAGYSLVLCRAMPRLDLLCVDPWRYYPSNPKQYSQDRHDRNYAVAAERLAPYRATLQRMTSMEAVVTVPHGSLDFVYLDGNHAYPYVVDDLREWSQRVRVGGIVAGDDYDAPGVQRALREYVAAQGIAEWWLTDDSNRKARNRRGSDFTSWWWVKC